MSKSSGPGQVGLFDAPPSTPVAKTKPTILSVTQVSEGIRSALRSAFTDVWVQGEVADFKGIHRSGHLYFALKDSTAQVRAVMWKGSLQKVPFEVKGGLEVIIRGKVDYYPAGGSLQIVVEHMEPVGIGALQLKFEQLKEKLKNEGLFDPSKKRKILPLNWRIGLVTGKSTAALQDILKIYKSRFPLAEVFLFHASVQGDAAPAEICSAIKAANDYSVKAQKPLDVLVIARGGGSYEDLFCFNDEAVARAIASSGVPTVSAIGHEIDITIADMVADKRSATPSHAAQETVPESALWLERLNEIRTNFIRQVQDLAFDLQQRIDLLFSQLSTHSPQRKLELAMQAILLRKQRFLELSRTLIEKRKSSLSRISGILDALSPLKVLDRGYSIASHPNTGKAVRSISELSPGAQVDIRFPDGNILADVRNITTNKN